MTHVSRFPGNRPGEADESAPDRGEGCECLEHNHDKSKNCNFGIFDKMDVLQHNLAGAQSCYVQSTS